MNTQREPNQVRRTVFGPLETLNSRPVSDESRPDATAPISEELDAIDLRDWWMGVAAAEVEPMLAKMKEYGGMGRAIDLEEIGRGLLHSGVKALDFTDNSEAYRQELGVYFYLLGKFARWTAAVAEGRRVSDDTLHDIGVYVRMAQRIRAVGGWPS